MQSLQELLDRTAGPIYLADLLPTIDSLLIELLEGLTIGQSKRLLRIKDIALHLLDGNLRSLSMLRDGHFGVEGPKERTHQGLVDYLNALNASWIKATRRLSPPVIIETIKKFRRSILQIYIKPGST